MPAPVRRYAGGQEVVRRYRGAEIIYDALGEPVTLAGAYEDPVQADVDFGRWSMYRTPWRGYMDAWPVARLRDTLGMYIWGHWDGFQEEHRAPIAQLLSELGIQQARVEFGWNNIRYDLPDVMKTEKITEWTPRLQALQTAGIRPLILLNSNDGEPCPFKWITVTAGAASVGATSITLSGADVGQIRPHYTGLSLPGYRTAFPLITSFAGGVATLSAPLPVAVSAGSIQLRDLKFHPFSGSTLSGGVPNPMAEETYQGWLQYIKAVRDMVVAALGTSAAQDKGFDIEIWNELSFGSDFTNERNYYEPDRSYDSPATSYTNHGITVSGDEHFGGIFVRSVDWIRDPANGCEGVRVIDGFANTLPWQSGGEQWPGAYGFSRHAYSGMDYELLPTDGSYRTNQDAINADGTIQQPGWIPTNHPPGATEVDADPSASDFPEYWWYAYQTEMVARDVLPFPSAWQHHGRYEYRFGFPGFAKLAEVWQTEVNTFRAVWLEHVRAAAGNPAVDDPAVQALSHAKGAELVLRHYVWNAHKGVRRIFLYVDHTGGDYGFDFLPRQVYTDLTAAGYVLDNAIRAAAGVQYHSLKRLIEALEAGADSSLTVARKPTVEAVVEYGARLQFAGDGTPAHPDRWNREDFAVLPFQVNASKFAIACYVVTRSPHFDWNTSKGVLDPLRYRFPPQTFDLELGNIQGTGATISLYDPIMDATKPASIVDSTATSIRVRLEVTDYPRILFITEVDAGPLIQDISFEIIDDVPELSFITNIATAPVVSWGSMPDREDGGSTTLPSGTNHSISLTDMAYTDSVKVDVMVDGLEARWPIWGHDVEGQWRYISSHASVELPIPTHYWNFEAATLSHPITVTRAGDNLWLPDYLGVWRQFPANLAPMRGFRMINHANGFDYGWGVDGWEFRADDPGGASLSNPRGLQPQPARTNKVTAAKSNPADTTNCTITGPGVLSVVDDSAVLGATLAGFGPNVYKIDNSAGGSTTYVRFGGATGNTNGHSWAAIVRGKGKLLLYDGTTESGEKRDFESLWTYIRPGIDHKAPPSATAEMTVSVAAGDIAYAVVPQLEEAYYPSAPIPGGTGSVSRSGTIVKPASLFPSGDATVFVEILGASTGNQLHGGTGYRVMASDFDINIIGINGSHALTSYDGSDIMSPDFSIDLNTRNKGALALSPISNYRKIIANGGDIVSGIYTDRYANDDVFFGCTGGGENGYSASIIHRIVLHDVALDDTELIQLTTSGPSEIPSGAMALSYDGVPVAYGGVPVEY